MSKEDVLKMIKDEDAAYVDIRFTDPRGKLQHVTVMSDLVDEDFLDDGLHVRRLLDRRLEGHRRVGHETDARPESAYVDPFYAEKTICLHCSILEPDTGEPMSATRAARRRRPRPTSSRPASATWPISAPRRNSSCSTTCASPTR
jgi:glutamine synthetase